MTPEVSKVVVGLAWPLVVIILAIFYKQEVLSLKSLLPRVKKLKLLQAEVELEPAALQRKTGELIAVAAPGSIELKELPGLTRTQAIGNLERELHANLATVKENQIDILIRALAQTRLEAAFGIIYAGIFGSQIQGLIALEARRKVPASEAYTFYQKFEKQHPEIYEGYGFSGWIGFLKQRGLIEAIEDDLRITPQGDDFLNWLKATKLSINKAY